MNVPKQKYANQKPPYWYRLEGAVRLVLVDPNNHHLNLTKKVVGDSGTICSPVVCPENGCGFYRQIRLLGWEK